LSGLTIYKASAGSGKTFAITREYIHLLFRDADNYRHILGVTFTNKATAEMKGRIVAELHKLATGAASPYADKLCSDFRLTPQVLKQRSALILSKILHDYSHFSIFTIDSFFQRIIRTFAREIGFYQGFEIELDQSRILTAAVDQMIFELDANPVLKDWLVRFAENKIVEGSSWNFNRDIEKIGNEVFKENFKEFGSTLIDKITDKTFIHNFSEKLSHIRTNFENALRQKGLEAVAIIQKHALISDDFNGKSKTGIGGFFEKIAKLERFDKWEVKDNARNHFDNIDKWSAKTAPAAKKNDIQSAYNAGLNKLLGEIIAMHDDQLRTYQSAVEVQKNLYVLGVVADLLIHIREYTSGRNLFMISDTAQFLRRLIDGSDAPFVYERTGTFIHHFMIDEFQDTSALQWYNFKPLIVNSLAEGNENWVVGDVKQSIYRWRNSDWTILSEKITGEVYPHAFKVENLHYNYRSSRNIIQFNNSFFGNAIAALRNEVMASQAEAPIEGMDDFDRLLSNAYSDFAQLVPDKNNTDRGFVKVGVISKNDDSDLKFEDQVLEKLPAILENLQDQQYNLKDIAILVRTRAEGNSVSEFLLKYQKQKGNSQYRYDILSNDSLLLKNSEVIKWLVAAFTCIASPDDHLNKAFLAYQYAQYLYPTTAQAQESNSNTTNQSASNASNPPQVSGETTGTDRNIHSLFSSSERLSGKLGEFFGQENLKQYPVYELCDKLIEFFGLANLKSELPFIQAFQDMLQEYMRKEPVDLNSFLHWWEENQEKRVISMPDGQDAIRLMTFHTAKGLEFGVVLIPFGDWTFMKSGWGGNMLWCSTDVEPFADLELLPVNLSKGLEKTIFSRDYFREKALSYVDNLNLLYVAFTRAIDALYVFIPEPTKDAIDNNIGNLICQSLSSVAIEPSTVDYPAIRLNDYWLKDENTFAYGQLPLSEIKKEQEETISLDAASYTVRSVSDVVKQVIQANDYMVGEGETLASRINTGKIMHEVFQRIKTPDDVDDALLTLLLEGKISASDVKQLSTDIRKLLSNKKINDWFSSNWEVRTEAGILLQDGSLPRPDRVLTNGSKAVVIDYKFGETEQEANLWQVRNYMKYIRQMNYTQVEGYLWYVNMNKVVAVTNEPEQGRLF
jgi:ATP-dependent helicase/nuclease subunit A